MREPGPLMPIGLRWGPQSVPPCPPTLRTGQAGTEKTWRNRVHRCHLLEHINGYMSKTDMTITNRAAFNAVVSLACAAALGAAAGCAKHDAGAASAAATSPLPVTATPVRVGTLTTTFALSGTVVPERQANLASVISGTIRDVTVQIGDRVSA